MYKSRLRLTSSPLPDITLLKASAETVLSSLSFNWKFFSASLILSSRALLSSSTPFKRSTSDIAFAKAVRAKDNSPRWLVTWFCSAFNAAFISEISSRNVFICSVNDRSLALKAALFVCNFLTPASRSAFTCFSTSNESSSDVERSFIGSINFCWEFNCSRSKSFSLLNDVFSFDNTDKSRFNFVLSTSRSNNFLFNDVTCSCALSNAPFCLFTSIRSSETVLRDSSRRLNHSLLSCSYSVVKSVSFSSISRFTRFKCWCSLSARSMLCCSSTYLSILLCNSVFKSSNRVCSLLNFLDSLSSWSRTSLNLFSHSVAAILNFEASCFKDAFSCSKDPTRSWSAPIVFSNPLNCSLRRLTLNSDSWMISCWRPNCSRRAIFSPSNSATLCRSSLFVAWRPFNSSVTSANFFWDAIELAVNNSSSLLRSVAFVSAASSNLSEACFSALYWAVNRLISAS